MLYDAYGEVTPLEIYEDDESDEDLMDEDEELMRSPGFGLDGGRYAAAPEDSAEDTVDQQGPYRQTGSDR